MNIPMLGETLSWGNGACTMRVLGLEFVKQTCEVEIETKERFTRRYRVNDLTWGEYADLRSSAR